VQFGLAVGGTTTNDLTAGTQINGVRFPAGAGGFVLNGNRIVLAGDVVNESANEQRLNLPIELKGGLSWAFDATAGNLTLGGEVSGSGAINKQGAHTLTVLSNFTFNGAVRVAGGLLQVGNGGSAGSLGGSTVTVEDGATVALDRGDAFTVISSISGAGGVVKRGAGTMQLTAALGNTGPTVIEAGTLQITSRQVQVLAHRWSFNGNLVDSAGSADATIVEVGRNNASLSASEITMTGGSRTRSDYVSLGSQLLPKDGSPATIELWATQESVQNWSRIFDFGDSTAENLFMSWSRGTDVNLDRVEWKDVATATVDDSCAPYSTGTEYHIAMVIAPGAGNGGSTRVTWYAAPSSSGTLGPARGSFDTANTLAGFNDADAWLGRSQYDDSTANASYNEVRLWNRAFTASDLQQLHVLGPNSVGSFATNILTGSLSPQSDLELAAGAQLDLGGTMQQVASLAGAGNAVVQLDGGRLTVAAGGNAAATFAGTFTDGGSIIVDGILRLVGNATIASGIALTNNGTLDIMTWTGTLPAGFVNLGTVLDRSLVRISAATLQADVFNLTIQGYRGHNYQLQSRDDLASGAWQNLDVPQAGSDTPIVFTQPAGTGVPRRYYRVAVSP
jgi:autotransporter-associated beta strand protein